MISLDLLCYIGTIQYVPNINNIHLGNKLGPYTYKLVVRKFFFYFTGPWIEKG